MSDHEVRGLMVSVLRPADANGYDGTNGGLTSRVTRLVVVGICRDDKRKVIEAVPKDWRVFTPDEQCPAVHLVLKIQHGWRTSWSIRPTDWVDGRWYMAGGNYVTGDSRFSDLTETYGAVAVHDRHEEY